MRLHRLWESSRAPHSLTCWWRETAWWSTSTPRSRSTAGRSTGSSTRSLEGKVSKSCSHTGGRYEVGCERRDDGRAHDHGPRSYLCLLYYCSRRFAWMNWKAAKNSAWDQTSYILEPKSEHSHTLWNLPALSNTSVQVRLPPNPLWDRHSWTAKAEDNTCWDEEWRPPHGQMVGFTDICYIY